MAGLDDAQLLRRFGRERGSAGELAFRELVRRHGAMVLGVCRQILRHSEDADDAFQATFLVLVRKAPAIGTGESLAPWLYGVACRTARRARRTASRRRPAGGEEVAAVEVPSEDLYRLDLRPLLYEELGRLPDKYRDPIVLCHLEGKTHAEAARLLSWPIGTVSGRLSRGRRLLRSRLERRGVGLPSAVLPALGLASSRTAVAAPLLEATLNAATNFAAARTVAVAVAAPVLSLTQGVLKTMMLRKLATLTLVVLFAGAVSGAGWAHWSALPDRPAAHAGGPAAEPAKDAGDAKVPAAAPPPGSAPQPSPGSPPLMAANGPADCPLALARSGGASDDYCPIRSAARALRGMLVLRHGSTATAP
jgi:RNA polymerase sigma factor (sigma-70 family)